MYTIEDAKNAIEQRWMIESDVKEFYEEVAAKCEDMFSRMFSVQVKKDNGDWDYINIGTAAERDLLKTFKEKVLGFRSRFYRSDLDYVEIVCEYIEHLEKKYF